MIEKTGAIVLKSMKYRDTSKIVTVYAKRFGKMSCLAKGARTAKNKFGSSLEVLVESEIVFYHKQARDLHLLSQASTLRPFKKIHAEGDRLGVALSIAELVDRLAHEQEEQADLYGLLLDALEALEHSAKNFVNILYAFEVRLAGLFGYAPNFTRCARCGKALGTAEQERLLPFLLDKGGPVCAECRESLGPVSEPSEIIRLGFPSGGAFSRVMIPLRAPTRRLLERLAGATLSSVPMLEYESATGNELEETLRLYLQYHFDRFRPLRAPALFGLSRAVDRPVRS
jgi:DNA repair protein RecO (recombination protein O)